MDTITAVIEPIESHICAICIVCEESVPLSWEDAVRSRHGHSVVKICDKCKKAILKMREEIQ